MKRHLIVVLRWIYVIPAFVLGGMIATALYNYSMVYIGQGDIVEHLKQSDGFGGHYILGPIFCLASTATAVGGAIIAAMFTAPSHRGVVRVVFSTITAIAVIVTTWLFYRAVGNADDPWSTERIIRTSLVLIGLVVGIVLSASIDISELEADQKRTS